MVNLKLNDFDYTLPQELIAQFPLAQRAASRLLVIDQAQRKETTFSDLPHFLRKGDLLILNDTRVIHARLDGIKPTGGHIEVLIERAIGEHEALAQIRASHAPKPGTHILLEGSLNVDILSREGEFYLLRFPGEENLITLLERHGKLPLPPYIERHVETEDESRYQTVYARHHGSVAAPTAGLHFDASMLSSLKQHGIELAYLTLHVGAGTFQPVRINNLAEHRMHQERYTLPEETIAAIQRTQDQGGRIIAVGTTSLRALEGAALNNKNTGETDLFILPGFDFKVVDCLITNFHLPKSTLLMLVSAFGGMENLRQAYQYAIQQKYRFFSYGDAMFIHRA